MTMARGTGVTGELWEKLVNLENLEVQRAVELILWGCTGRTPTPQDLQTWPLCSQKCKFRMSLPLESLEHLKSIRPAKQNQSPNLP